MIACHDIAVDRGGVRVLDGITLAIPRGGITALIGPNGAGKSTLLHLVAGLVPPVRGSASVDGMALYPSRPADRALRMALLTQGQGAVSRLTVAELVAFGRWPHHRGRPGPADHAAAEMAMDAFDLRPLAQRMIESLSGGQRQRAWIAMALAQSTPWLLLDEPLAALDPRHARLVMERLHRLSRPGEGARSVVIVLHDLAMAARFADHVVALRDGRIACAGPAAEVMNSAMLTALYDTPLTVETLGGHRTVVPG